MRHYMTFMLWFVANKKELTQDLVLKAKQVEFLIQSLPQPEPEEEQVQGDLGQELVVGATNPPSLWELGR